MSFAPDGFSIGGKCVSLGHIIISAAPGESRDGTLSRFVAVGEIILPRIKDTCFSVSLTRESCRRIYLP